MAGIPRNALLPSSSDVPLRLEPLRNELAAAGPTIADAVTSTGNALGGFIQQQRQKSVEMGLLDPNTGLPTRAGVLDAARQYGDNLLLGTTAPNGLRAYHGSPHSFDQFKNEAIGTGEGAQVYGHGLYFAENEAVARSYRDKLSAQQSYLNNAGDPVLHADAMDALASAAGSVPGTHPDQARQLAQSLTQALADVKTTRRVASNYDAPKGFEPQWDAALNRAKEMGLKYNDKPGHMYEVQVNANPEHFLDWDKPLSQQHQVVQEALLPHVQTAIDREMTSGRDPGMHTGGEAYSAASSVMPGFEAGGSGAADLSQRLQQAGIPGIRYLDGSSRSGGEGSRNTVVFDPATIEILRKYGIAGLLGGGAAAAATPEQ